MVLDGRVAALWGGGTGWPGFTAVAKAGAPLHRARRRTRSSASSAKHTFLKPLTLPAGTLPRPDRADPVGRLVELRHGAPDLDDDVAYRLARALHRGEAALAARLPQAAETTAANTAAAAPRPS